MPAPRGHAPYPGCETGGRPIKYTKEFIENEATAFLEWMSRADSMWYKDFALERGYLPENLTAWAKINDKFSYVYKHSQAWQQSKLVKGGLGGSYNPSFTKFVMSNTCDWRERQETKLSGDAINPLAFLLQQADGVTKDLVKDAR